MEQNDDMGLPDETGLAADTGQNVDTGQAGSSGQVTDAELTNDTGPSDDTEQDYVYSYYLPPSEEPPDDLDQPDDTGQMSNTSQASNTGQANNTGQGNGTWQTEGEFIEVVTKEHIDILKKTPRSSWPTPKEFGVKVLQDMQNLFSLVNMKRAKGEKLPIPRALLLVQIALFMAIMFHIVRIACAGEGGDDELDVLAIYMDHGPDEGTYVESTVVFHQTARQFNQWLRPKECNEIIEILRTLEEVPRVTRCRDRDLIAVNNGIFDYRTKELLPFSPSYVFLAKSHVNYNPNAINVIICNPDDGTRWDVESWIKELSDDPEIVNLIWEILGAIIRPLVPWDKSAWFFAEDGNNGKGTLCVLMRNLCGEGAYASITIKEFAKQFGLEALMQADAVIVDENPVGVYVDETDKLKAVITHDVISIDRKHKRIIKFQFYGFMVQCLNELPRFKDKSDSFYRRQLFVPFTKCFTGKERKYIKEDYLGRKEVLEYVLYRVLHMHYYELSNPQACQQVLQEYKEYNDPVRQFFHEMEFAFVWNLLPFQFLYDLYKSWFARNNPRGSIQGRNTFIKELERVTKTSKIWEYHNTNDTIRTCNRMDDPEPMILQYDLEYWKNPEYVGSNTNIITKTKYKDAYHGGLVRRNINLHPKKTDNSKENIGTT